MFGYIKVDQANLLVKEYEAYKGIYCALCKQLGKDYSIIARFILSYDCTFYAMLALDLEEKPPCYYQGRCRFNPMKKCNYAESESESLPLAAALSVISAYYKLKDNLFDSPWYKRIAYRLIQPFFSRWRKKARKRYPEIDIIVYDMMERQFKAEHNPRCVLDEAAEPTAMMLSELCGLLTKHICLRKPLEHEQTDRILRTIGYFLGRWIYLIDAADDFEKDKKHRNFNPFLIPVDISIALPERIEALLNHALSESLLAYGLLRKGRFDHIILNVLQNSCVITQKQILLKYKPEHLNNKDLEK